MACGEGWPSCWTAKVWREKRKDYIWLICKDGKLGCDVCRVVSSLGVHKSKNVHLSQERSSQECSPITRTIITSMIITDCLWAHSPVLCSLNVLVHRLVCLIPHATLRHGLQNIIALLMIQELERERFKMMIMNMK